MPRNHREALIEIYRTLFASAGDNPLTFEESLSRAAGLILDAYDAGTVVLVGPGGKYETVTAGLAAASSGMAVVVLPGTAGAAYVESVTVPAGVTLATVGPVTVDGDMTLEDSTARVVGDWYLTGTVSGGVIERPAAPATKQGGYVGMHEASPDQWMLSYVGGLIAIRGDDIRKTWIDSTYAAQCGGVSPLAYARSKGIRITLAAPSSFVDNGPGFTAMDEDDLQVAIRDFGAEICSHSQTHSAETDPRAASDLRATAYDEIVGSKLALEALTTDNDPEESPGNRLGIKIRGWVEPGDWGPTDGRAEIDDEVSRLVRENYEWGMDYAFGNANDAGGVPVSRPLWLGKMPRYHASYYGSTAISETYGTALAYIKGFAYHGVRSCFLWHMDSASAATRFKNMCDAIAAIRDDKATYPLLHLESVTLSEMMLGLQPAAYVSGGALQIPCGILYEDFEQFASGALGSSINIQPMLITTSGGDSSIETGDATYGQYLRLAYQRYLMLRGCVEHGRSHMVRIRAKASASLSCQVRMNWWPFDEETRQFNQYMTSITIGTSWAQYNIPWAFEGWSNGASSLSLINNTSGETLDIAEVRVL